MSNRHLTDVSDKMFSNECSAERPKKLFIGSFPTKGNFSKVCFSYN